jgi:hypothetical protein
MKTELHPHQSRWVGRHVARRWGLLRSGFGRLERGPRGRWLDSNWCFPGLAVGKWWEAKALGGIKSS